MFVRVKIKKGSPKRAIQIVDSVRIGDQVKQRIIRHLGMAETDAEEKALRAYGDSVIERMKGSPVPVFPPEGLADRIQHARRHPPENWRLEVGDDLTAVQSVNEGIHDVFGEIYRDLGLDRILPRYRYRTSNRALYHSVMARLAQPCSKRATSSLLGDDYGVSLPLQKIYRMMDHLDEDRIGRLKGCAARSAEQLFPDPVDVVFFDCTTLNFESFRRDELKEPGWSKDAKFKESQMLLALFVTSGGLPLGYELMPGSTSEVTSLIPAVSALKKRMDLRHAVCVADRGMISRENLRALEEAGLDWIVGAPIRRMNQRVKKQVLESSGRTPSRDGGSSILDLDLENGTRLVVSFSRGRAARDRHSREELLTKLRTRIGSSRPLKASSLAGNQGWHRYVKFTNDAAVEIDEEKVRQDEKWDGVHGVLTSLSERSAEEILDQYLGLWQVEETFRITKHDLKIRPIYHWTPLRIHAHVAIAFMSLLCTRHLLHRLRLRQVSLSPAAVRSLLARAESWVLREPRTGKHIAVPFGTGTDVSRIYAAVGKKPASKAVLLH